MTNCSVDLFLLSIHGFSISSCGDYGTEEHEAGVENGEGNYNTDIHNVIAGRGFPCSSFDCGDPSITNNGADVVNTDPEFLLNESGNWYGRHFPIDNNEGVWSQSFPQLEMENPWIDNKNRSTEQLVTIFGEDPFENDRIQSYDFRPKKGSVLIDNDSQSMHIPQEIFYQVQYYLTYYAS